MVWRQGRVGRDLIQHRMTLGSLAFGSGQSWNVRQTSQRHLAQSLKAGPISAVNPVCVNTPSAL